MADIHFESFKEYPDLWMRPVTRSDGTLYCQIFFLYTDYILYIMEDPELFLHKDLGARFTLKEN